MKKKRLKIIGKISCVALLFSVLVSALVVPSFAWQNTNHAMASQWFRGVNSYSLAPLNSLYYEYWSDADNITTNYSINAPNTLTFEGKTNWLGAGQPLNYNRYSETFGNNSRGRMYCYTWDTFVSNTEYPPLTDLPYENIISVENNPNVSIYPSLKIDDVWTTTGVPGTNVDAISYVVTRTPGTNDNVSLVCYYDSFISTQRFSRNLITYQWASTDIETTPLHLKYSFTYADIDGILHNVNGDFLYMGTASGETYQDNLPYEVDSVSVLDAILTYEEEVNNRDGLDRESSRPIEWSSVYIAPNYYGENTIIQCGVTSPYLRPYDQALIDSASSGDANYRNGFYTSLRPYQNTIWLTLYERDAIPDNPGDIPTTNLDLGPLGETIGGAVTGVFEAEIFPGISLWTILLIPFSLGLVFTFIKFFAGG